MSGKKELSPQEVAAMERRRERITNWLALFILLSIGVVWPPLFAQQVNLDEVQTGTLWLKSAPDAQAVWALRQSTSIKATITGNLARV